MNKCVVMGREYENNGSLSVQIAILNGLGTGCVFHELGVNSYGNRCSAVVLNFNLTFGD